MITTRIIDTPAPPSEGGDFVVRRRPFGLQLSFVFGVASLAIVAAAFVMRETGSALLFFGTLILIMGSLAWFTIFFAVRNRDLVLATEFMNTLLASAAQFSLRFCLITKADGSIVYVDSGFQKFFPKFMRSGSQTIHNLLLDTGIPEEASQSISQFLEKNQSGRVVVPFKDSTGKSLLVMISIDVLARPKGYLLLRGRDYVENRNQPKNIVTTQLMETINGLQEGVLIRNEEGKITYVSRRLEERLSYKPGEMLNSNISVDQLFRFHGGEFNGKPISGEFQGDVIARARNGAQIILYARQIKLQDENNKPIGYGTFLSSSADVKTLNT